MLALAAGTAVAAPPGGGDAEALATRIAARRRAWRREFPPGSLPLPTPSIEEATVALAAVQLAKARDCAAGAMPDPVAATQALAVAAQLLDRQAHARPPRLVAHGRIVEQAYFAHNDGSPQPYFLYVPPACDADPGPHPLMVFLHGWVPDTCRTNPWLVTDDVLDLADRHRCLFVIPHGRTNTDFQFAGEVDVVQVIRDMQAFHPVDPDRVYLVGASMGGAGAWELGVHYPDLFAGIAPVSAQGDWFHFWQQHFQYPPRAQLPRHVAWVMAAHNPLDLAPNLLTVFSYSQHATTCFVGVEHSRAMAARLRAAGAPHEFFEDPSPQGHFIYFETACWERVFAQLMPRRRVADPERVRYATYSPRFPGAWGLEIARLAQWGRPAAFEARWTGRGALELKTANVAAMRLTPSAARAGTNGTVRVTWNGRDLGPQRASPGAPAAIEAPGAAPAPALAKSRAVCGPASDVYNFPFVVVRGTAGTPEETRALAGLAERFARDWDDYAEGEVAVIRDVDVTDALLRASGLVLFGLPESNAIVKRLAPRLPFKLAREAYELPDGRRFDAATHGLALTYPNPLAPGRYVQIWNGLNWGQGRSCNHRFDLLPDYAIFTAEPLPGMGINRYAVAGMFDEAWQYRPELADFGVENLPHHEGHEEHEGRTTE